MGRSDAAEPSGHVPDDPGWRPALARLWRNLIPFLNLRDLRKSQSDQPPGITGLRRIFVSFASALLLFLVVLVTIFPPEQAARTSGAGVAIGVLVGGMMALAAALAVRRRTLTCQDVTGLVRSYVQLVFLRIAFAQAPALFGFVGAFLVEALWPYLLGLALSAAGYAAAAPTASDIRRHDQELMAAGCPHSLRAGLYRSSEPPP